MKNHLNGAATNLLVIMWTQRFYHAICVPIVKQLIYTTFISLQQEIVWTCLVLQRSHHLSIQIQCWVPTESDIDEMLSNFGILVSRILVQYMPFFKEHFSDVVVKHIPHEHQSEMEKISEVVKN